MGSNAGQLAFQIGGTVIGSYFGGPVGGAIGGAIGGVVGGLLFRTKKPLINDTQTMNSTYGNPIPILYGTARLGGIMFWQTQIETKSAGFLAKGGSKYPFNYYQSAGLMFCEGPAQLEKIWLDGKLFWDNTVPNPGEITKHTFAFRAYTGTDTQIPDYKYASWCEAYVDDPAAVPAYRGIAYLILDGLNLDYYGNRFPQVTASWSVNAAVGTLFNVTAPFVPDVSSDAGVAGNTGYVATDWVRGLVYQYSNDGTLRSYDLNSYTCLNAKTAAEWYSGPALLLGEDMPPTWESNAGGIVCGSGGNLYVWCGDFSTPYNTIYEIDPNSLTLLKVMNIPCPGKIWSMMCWTEPVTSTGGTGDVLVGSLFESDDPFAFILYPQGYIDPVSVPQAIATWYTPLAAAFGGCNQSLHFSTFANATPDPASGATILYVFDYPNTMSGSDAIIMSTWQVNGAIATPWAPVQTLTAAAFGQAVPGAFDCFVPIVDPLDNNLILLGMPWFAAAPSSSVTIKINPTDLDVLWINNASPYMSTAVTQLYNCDLSTGTLAVFWFATGQTGVPIMDTQDGSVTYSPLQAGQPTAEGSFNLGLSYNSNVALQVMVTGPPTVVKLNIITTSAVSIGDILLDLCARVGVTADMVDVSLVTQTTTGYVVHDNKSCGAAIAELCNTFLIDMVESDYTLRFVPRGAAAVATIPQDDLASQDPDDPSQYWIPAEAQEQDLPLQIAVKYSDPDLDYQPGSAYARRTALPVPTVYSKRKLTMDLPVVTDNLTARTIAANILFSTWAARETYNTTLGPKYLWLDPTDNIAVSLDNGDSYTVRIESIDTGADLTQRLHCGGEDLTVYAPLTLQPVTYGVGKQVIVTAGFAKLLQLNVPLLQDSDAAPTATSRVYFAAAAPANSWPGGQVYKSTDGVNWPVVAALASGCNYGTTVNALAAPASLFATDTINSVRVSFATGSTLPSSCAYSDLMNGANAVLIGGEVLQFQTVTDNADSTVTLSTLIRARRGTDYAVASHAPGELVLLLQPGYLTAGTVGTGEINVQEQWELVPVGASQAQSLIQLYTPLGYDLFPYSPVNFARAVSGSDLVATWVRRTRIGGLLMDGTDTAPLNEDTECYDAYILPSAAALASFDPTNAATYTRAFLALTAPTLTYTAAEMSADGFIPATQTLYLVVYQLSGVVGRGFQGYQALPAF